MIIGHQRQLQLLDLHIRTGTVSHAYLFAGPRHVGKMTVALQMISSLLCKNRPVSPLASCSTCESCRSIAAGTHPDVTVEDIYAHEEKQQEHISIDSIRRIRDLAARSAHGSTRIFILRDGGRLTREASHAFLKTLEEPRGDILFLLLVEKLEEVLPTIRSRVWTIRFWPSPEGFIPANGQVQISAFLSIPVADHLRHADTLRDYPDRMQTWYKDIIALMSNNLHEQFIAGIPSPSTLVFLARTIKLLMEGEERFSKPFGTKRIIFESDILKVSTTYGS